MAGQKTPDKVEYIPTGQEVPPDYWDPIARILAREFKEMEQIAKNEKEVAISG